MTISTEKPVTLSACYGLAKKQDVHAANLWLVKKGILRVVHDRIDGDASKGEGKDLYRLTAEYSHLGRSPKGSKRSMFYPSAMLAVVSRDQLRRALRKTVNGVTTYPEMKLGAKVEGHSTWADRRKPDARGYKLDCPECVRLTKKQEAVHDREVAILNRKWAEAQCPTRIAAFNEFMNMNAGSMADFEDFYLGKLHDSRTPEDIAEEEEMIAEEQAALEAASTAAALRAVRDVQRTLEALNAANPVQKKSVLAVAVHDFDYDFEHDEI